MDSGWGEICAQKFSSLMWLRCARSEKSFLAPLQKSWIRSWFHPVLGSYTGCNIWRESFLKYSQGLLPTTTKWSICHLSWRFHWNCFTSVSKVIISCILVIQYTCSVGKFVITCFQISLETFPHIQSEHSLQNSSQPEPSIERTCHLSNPVLNKRDCWRWVMDKFHDFALNIAQIV